jgi:hypothetical protein
VNTRQLEAAWFGRTAKSKAEDFADKVQRAVQELGRPDNRDANGDEVEMHWSVKRHHDCYIEISMNRGRVGGRVRGDWYTDPKKAAKALDEWSEEIYEG